MASKIIPPTITIDSEIELLAILVAQRAQYHKRVYDPDINGNYMGTDNDRQILDDLNKVIRFVAVGGFTHGS